MSEREILTTTDFLLCFQKTSEDARWIASADSEERLGDLLYFYQRNNRDMSA